MRDIQSALDLAEQDPACKVVILEGQDGIFCTGMDFQDVLSSDASDTSALYMETIKRFATSSKIIIAKIDGVAMAGGVGLAAASDLCIATPRSQFSLSEAIWGLLPSMVLPYLIRRVGYQTAYKMTLTTQPIMAQEALAVQLVDEISDFPDRTIRQYRQRLDRLAPSTVSNMKQYFRKMWMITEEMEQLAVSETTRLLARPEVQDNLRNFITNKKFPWENE